MQAYNVIYLKQHFAVYSALKYIYLCGLKLCVGQNQYFYSGLIFWIIFCFFNTFIFYFAVQAFVMKMLRDEFRDLF